MDQLSDLTELHSHLYGAIPAEILYDIGKRNLNPRWSIYTDAYEKIFKERMDSNLFFKVYDSLDKFKELYYFSKKAPFDVFQCKFNLIIALAEFSIEEIQFISKQVLFESSIKGVSYSEFRIMYNPFATEVDYYEKTLAACIGLSEGELAYNVKGRLVVSLHRQSGFEVQYEWLKKAMKSNEIISKYLVGIDFCNTEEGFPPKYKKEFFKKVLLDNQIDPTKSLSILYHVGESFQDKSHLSACRWILESSEYGAHRLGHCIALGETLDKFIGTERLELIEEYIDTNEYILNHYDEILEFGKISKFDLFRMNLVKSKTSPLKQILVKYDETFLENLDTFRKYVIHKLIKNNSVIESCPSSNFLIGMIDTYDNLPIKAFSETDLKLTISADDPGIFNIDLQGEYRICESIGIASEKLNKIKVDSKLYTSEILSGRKNIAP